MSERKSRGSAAHLQDDALKGTWSESATRVLRERYLMKDEHGQVIETPDEMCWRVARAIASAEAQNSGKSPEEIEQVAAGYARLMLSRRFMPNSPTLMNAGKGNNLQLSACFVIPVEDSLEGIFESVKHAAIVHQSGGGTGFAFSRLRPAGSIVASTHGVASGPVSFMKIFDAATESVRQGGTRRGANMGILRVDHPDIEEFIACKMGGGITNFNISVAITDEFMDALEHDREYDLVDPHTQQVVKRKRAREIFDKIVHAAWATGDPGLVFIDRINASPANPTPEIEPIEATNPCVVGSTLLATSQGLQRMDALFAKQGGLVVVTDVRASAQLGEAKVVNGAACANAYGVAYHEAVPVFKTGENVPVRKLITSHGIEIIATPNHRFLTTQGYKRLDHLEFGDELLLQSGEGAWSQDRKLPAGVYDIHSEPLVKAKIERGEARPPTEWSQELGEVFGYALGDGWIRREKSADVVGFAVEDADLKDLIQQRITAWFGAAGNVTECQGHFQVTYQGTPATFLWGLGLTTDCAHEKRVPASVFTAPRDAVIGFLRGLFSAAGSLQIGSPEKGTWSVRLATSSKELAQDVQQLLLNFGIVSAIRLRRADSIRLMPNAPRELAECETQARYEVIIDKDNRDRFAEIIGFMQLSKQSLLADWIAVKKRASDRETFITKVALIEDAGTADVFDTTEPLTHSIIVNGLVTHQCGEQPLGPYDACNLGSINLGMFVGADKQIDWDALSETVHLCVRFLDDVIDVNPYPLKAIRDKVHANRRIGLGVMGWADMLFKLGIRYDSEEAVQLGEKVMRFISDEADKASLALGEERGVFPNWPRSIYKDGLRLRNSNRTTVAPTGTISIIADCSSGIEPIFALAFQHRVKQPDGSYRVLDFVNPVFMELLEAAGIENQEEIIAYVKEHGSLHGHPAQSNPALAAFVTAHEIAPDWHIRMQAAFQKGVNSSISKTINLPNSATHADVEHAYMLAWELGCLGITIFRDGCKGEQVLNVGVKKDEQPAKTEAQAAPSVPAPQPVAAPAPPSVPAAQPARRSNYTNGVKDRPEMVRGYTRRVRAPEGSVYVTLNEDDDGLLEVFITVGKAGSDVAALADALGRLISLQLRTESPLSQNERARAIAEQLRAIGGSSSIGFGVDRVRSLPDAVSRAIREHLDRAQAAEAQDDPPANGYANGSGGTNGHVGGGLPTFPQMQQFAVIGNLCPQCGCNTLVYAEGCKKCLGCGYSEC